MSFNSFLLPLWRGKHKKEMKGKYFRNLCIFSSFANPGKGTDEQHFTLHDWVAWTFPGAKSWTARDTEEQIIELHFPTQCLHQEWFCLPTPLAQTDTFFSCCRQEVEEFKTQTFFFISAHKLSHTPEIRSYKPLSSQR